MSKDLKYQEALRSILTYCNYQERSKSEIWQKLRLFELSELEKSKILDVLIEQDIINEKRFAEAFISGKYRIKKWGRNKIRAALRSKQISNSAIELGFRKIIDQEEYLMQLEVIFTNKWKLLKNKKDISTKGKLYRYLFAKGYESEDINRLFARLIK